MQDLLQRVNELVRGAVDMSDELSTANFAWAPGMHGHAHCRNYVLRLFFVALPCTSQVGAGSDQVMTPGSDDEEPAHEAPAAAVPRGPIVKDVVQAKMCRALARVMPVSRPPAAMHGGPQK